MESQVPQQSTPVLKVEHSPAESLLSIPASAEYSPLFSPTSVGTPEGTPAPMSLNSQETTSPKDSVPPEATTSEAEILASFSIPIVSPSPAPTPPAEKKPTKKRKSWGQVLPEPKTNLPPRKRAKTEDEKEQRRVERVLRNRRAAQSSRERKRQETEKLEQRNRELETVVSSLQRTNLYLLNAIREIKSGNPTNSPALDTLLNSPTLARSLFGGDKSSQQSSSLDFTSVPTSTSATVDPSRLSPSLGPIPEVGNQPASEPSATADQSSAPAEKPVDLAQHPAAVLCDLQCQSTEQLPRAWTAWQQQQALAWMVFLTSATSAALSIFRTPAFWVACSLKAGLPLPPSRQLLNTIIWMVTRASSRTTSSSNSTSRSQRTQRTPPPSNNPSSPTDLVRPSPGTSSSRTLRSKYLRKILTCSPGLARPLADATLDVLRLVSEGHGDQVSGRDVHELASDEVLGDGRVLPEGWIPGAPLPSREVLVTLLWAIKVEERKLRKSRASASAPGSHVASTSAVSSRRVLQVLSKRRCRSEEGPVSSPEASKLGQ